MLAAVVPSGAVLAAGLAEVAASAVVTFKPFTDVTAAAMFVVAASGPLVEVTASEVASIVIVCSGPVVDVCPSAVVASPVVPWSSLEDVLPPDVTTSAVVPPSAPPAVLMDSAGVLGSSMAMVVPGGDVTSCVLGAGVALVVVLVVPTQSRPALNLLSAKPGSGVPPLT